jgi:hypothetical protein
MVTKTAKKRDAKKQTAKKHARSGSKAKNSYDARRHIGKAGKGTFEGFVRSMPKPLRPLAEQIVSLVSEAVPGLSRELKWGWPAFTIPGKKGMERVLCSMGAVGDRYLNLMFFKGAKLHDPKRRLEGTGKGMRHIKVRSRADVDGAYFKKLAKQARALVG